MLSDAIIRPSSFPKGGFVEINLGFSTGCLYQSDLSITNALRTIRRAGCRVVELGFVKLDNFWSHQLDEIQLCDLSFFDHVSLHAPTYSYGNDLTTEAIFAKIERLNRVRTLDLVIFHPDAIVDRTVFDEAPFRVAFENMDNRKSSCRVPEDLEPFFSDGGDFSMVLDVNHVFTNDSSMELAGAFYRRFRTRIREVHVSGYSGYHEPLFQTHQREIVGAIQDLSVPIVVEGIMAPAEIAQEREYILQTIRELHS